MKKKSLPASPSASDRPSRDGSLGGVVIVVLVAIAILTISCKNTPTEPERRIKTPREMTWTATTITSPDSTSIQVLPEKLVVFSENDMWLVCWSDVARGLLWHYDGKTWTESNIVADVGGMRVNDVAGYSSSDLWTAGYSGDKIFLGHYDGMHWTRRDNMNIKGELLDMCKDPDGNLWACGRNGVILKYDKTKWIADTIKIQFNYPVEYFLKSIKYYNGNIYLLASSQNTSTLKQKYFYIRGNIGNWTIADSMLFDSPTSIIKWGNSRLYASNYGKLYSVGLEGIWVYGVNGWEQIYRIDSSIYSVWGIDENYNIAAGDFQQVLFYNGSSWENIASLFPQIDRGFVCTITWTSGYDTFIIGYTTTGWPMKTIIFHGK